jgi:serine/threonine-protein kinase
MQSAKAGKLMQLDGYSKLLKIDEGGMAYVYRGIQEPLQRPVAIKLLINGLSRDKEARHRVDRESYIIARLTHPNIIHVIDRGITADEMPYFVMEYVEGLDLGTASKINEISHTSKIDIIIQILKALSYAHQNNVIHRDIKPENILIDNNGNVKILDFGIAQFYEEKIELTNQTTSGTVMGTYNYMSPEQRESSENVMERSALYSVGVVMYEMFTGKIPTGVFPEPIRLNDEIEPELNKLTLGCLNQDPELRPRSAELLKNDLLAISQDSHLDEEQRLRAEQGITKIKSKFLLLDILREDKLGTVYLYQQKDRNNLLIINKKVSSSAGFEASNLLASLEHENIVKTHGTSRNDRHFILVQEYLSGGTLNDKLAFQLNWEEILRIASQICQAMIFAHNNRIVHGHLRPTNILFTTDGQVKLADFSTEDDLTSVENSQFYRLDGEPRSKASDIYATSVILYQLFTGSLPRRSQDTSFVMRKSFTKFPGDIQLLIANMISTIPEYREGNSLQRAVELFRQHIQNKHDKTFTKEGPERKRKVRDRKESAADRKSATPLASEKQYKSPIRARMGFLFGLLLLIFVQYLTLFDGQEKINKSLPEVCNILVNQISELRTN